MSLVKKEYFISIKVILLSLILILPIISLFLLLFYLLFLSDDITIEIKLKIGISVLFLVLALILLEAIPRFINHFKLLITKKPALILTDENLIDNINSQTYLWNDINKISIGSVNVRSKINFIAISLSNPKSYIDTIKNPYKKVIAKINSKYFRGTFSIQPNLLKCNNKELFEALIEYKNSSIS